ncbi:unnamed protein product [Caenorhabditis sp. 36 PRJEB53466]|nr:unnamed protein product [Caenorhabditis sp. 36 PRJEB53466]
MPKWPGIKNVADVVISHRPGKRSGQYSSTTEGKQVSWHELIAYGIILNVLGAALLLIKAQLDKDVIKAAVEQKFRDAGIRVNSTDGSEGEDEILAEPSAVLMVMITMGGRMANVVGTMKLYKGLGKYLSDRKRKKFQTTTERIQNGEAETECTELLADCCQIF